MVYQASGPVVRQIGSLFEGGSVAGLADRQLLERFIAQQDAAGEAAFAALVSRHGPMILDVCRQVLGDPDHAEDAFQAVFLVLTRKARSIRDPDLLGNWLYGVAIRTARCAKLQLDEQRNKEEGDVMTRSGPGSSAVLEPMAPPAEQAAVDREEAEALHDEIDRLPKSFRLPIVLCYFEGLTLDEAARQLRWPAGTLRSRLARAREKLRISLTRRGIALPDAALGAGLTPRIARAAVSSSLCHITTRAAMSFASGQAAAGAGSASAIALAQEVLRSMLVTKLKLVALAFLLVGAAAAGAGFVAQVPARQAGRPGLQEREAGKPDLHEIAAKADDANTKPGRGRMFVVGRVLDPLGKPVPGASVMVYSRSIMPFSTDTLLAERIHLKEIGRAAGDGSGRFHADVPRTSSSRHDAFGAVALAPGYGAGWVELDPDADAPAADITLGREQVIVGRLFDLQGQPARDVKLLVTSIRRALPGAPSPRGERLEGPAFWWTHPDDLAGWPSPAITGADGRFTVHGAGPGHWVSLSVLDPRFISQIIVVNTGPPATTVPLSFVLQPARALTGRVTYADTGKPVPHAVVRVAGFKQPTGVAMPPITTVADADGRFRANPGSGANGILTAEPPTGQAYLTDRQRVAWPKGAVTHSVDLALPRGVMMHGTVTEHGTGRPISAAIVSYAPHRAPDDGMGLRPIRPVETMADGSFVLPVLPHAGYLTVQAPSYDYVLQEHNIGLIQAGRPRGPRMYAHAFVSCDPKPGGDGEDVKVALRPGVTVKGRVVGPDGQPVAEAWMLSRIHLGPTRIWSGHDHGTARNGRFELHGLDLDSEVPVSFFEPTRKLGATVHFSGKLASGEAIVVKLKPCAAASARLVDPGGKPLARFQHPALISMVVTPGESSLIKARNDGTTLADQGILTNIDPINYSEAPAADTQGRIEFRALIPGATYRIIDGTTNRDPTGPELRKEFTVKSGETLDLGDILIKRPPPP